MQLHQLQPTTTRKTAKRVGRGGKRGKTSGKGGKGQTARAGGRPRPEMRDFIKRIPKLRGFGRNRGDAVNSERILAEVVNLAVIEKMFDQNDTVSPQSLVQRNIISLKKGKVPAVKILGTGEITKKLTFSGCVYSVSAKAKIEKTGGSVL